MIVDFIQYIQYIINNISSEYYGYFILGITIICPFLILMVFESDNAPITIMFFLYLSFVQYFGVYDIISMFTMNAVYILPSSILYCIIGTIISLIKWWLFVRRDTEKNKLTSYKSKESNFEKYVSDHSIKIQRWILLWPMALLNLFLGELYRFVGTMIFEKLYNKYVQIAISSVSYISSEGLEKENFEHEEYPIRKTRSSTHYKHLN